MALFAKVDQNGAVVEFPVYEQDVRKAFPHTSLPSPIKIAPEGYVIVEETPAPAFDAKTQKVVDGGAKKEGTSYVRVWNVVALSVEEALAIAKADRLEEVRQIQVTTASDKVFDGDEDAQGRMARAIVALNDGESTLWVLADNTPTMVTKEELKEALRLAGAEMTAIWVRPYQ